MKTSRVRYMLESKKETVHVIDQTVFDWVKVHRQTALTGADGKALVIAK